MSEGALPPAPEVSTGLRPTKLPPSPEQGFGFQPTTKPHSLEAMTARSLAFWLIAMLGVSVLGQYASIGILVWRNRLDAIQNFEHLFNAWLPVISGLSSAAVTYYLTREKK
jgi:hypothetical protein